MDDIRVNSGYVAYKSGDCDVHASIAMRLNKSEHECKFARCVKCRRRLPVDEMALVGNDCYECKECLK